MSDVRACVVLVWDGRGRCCGWSEVIRVVAGAMFWKMLVRWTTVVVSVVFLSIVLRSS